MAEGCFTGTAPIIGIFAAGLMRAAFQFALAFARRETRGGVPIIEHQAVGHALADAKGALEAVRSLSLRAVWAVDTQAPDALELALHAKVFGSEAAVRVIADLMRVVGIDSYDRSGVSCRMPWCYRCSTAATWGSASAVAWVVASGWV